MIDLRSDTVTRPTPAMLEAMRTAEVGDDVYGEDPSVNALEADAAALFGTEAALFCASGTMANQIAIKAGTQPGDEVICDSRAHIYHYEGGGIAFHAGASVRLLPGDRGRLTPEQIEANVNADDVHYPRTSLVALENTVNKAGGSFYTLEQIRVIRQVCRRHGLWLHLDGARVFNALLAAHDRPQDYGAQFDTLSVCLSKGLGAPVGSVLLGSADTIRQARRLRKLFGGGWRQAGYLAAAGKYALQHHVERLSEDHERARILADHLGTLPYVARVAPADTNIVLFDLAQNVNPAEFIAFLKFQKILVSPFGGQSVRLVTHLDFTDKMLQQTYEALQAYATVYNGLPA